MMCLLHFSAQLLHATSQTLLITNYCYAYFVCFPLVHYNPLRPKQKTSTEKQKWQQSHQTIFQQTCIGKRRHTFTLFNSSYSHFTCVLQILLLVCNSESDCSENKVESIPCMYNRKILIFLQLHFFC